MSGAGVVVVVGLCVLAGAAAASGTWLFARANPGERLRFRLFAPPQPLRRTRADLALQLVALGCVAGAARVVSGPGWWPWAGVALGLVVLVDLLPRAGVLWRHNRRLQGPPSTTG